MDIYPAIVVVVPITMMRKTLREEQADGGCRSGPVPDGATPASRSAFEWLDRAIPASLAFCGR
jgi:hypothetical protein